MKFKPVAEKKRAWSPASWVQARFELSEEEQEIFHRLRKEAGVTVNQLIKQMVIFCIQSSKEDE